jgi:spore coat protein A, manganese oxidase
MPAPVSRKKILLGPGERVEVIADFSGLAGKRVELSSVRRGGGHKDLGSTAYVGKLMQFQVGDPIADQTGIPATLRPLPAWVASAPASPRRKWKFTVGDGLLPSWLVNGKTFDPSRSDAFPVIDTTETWELHNATAVAHMIHLHHTDWYMLSRNGKRPAPFEDCLKETFFLDPGDRVVVAGHFSDHLGKFVIHCHMLDHEDHGLMSQFEVVAPGAI